jgi:hypothetical protein
VVLLLVDLSAAVVVQQVHQEQAQAVLAARAISMLAVLDHQEQELLWWRWWRRGWIYMPTAQMPAQTMAVTAALAVVAGGGASTLGTAGSGGNGVVLSLL